MQQQINIEHIISVALKDLSIIDPIMFREVVRNKYFITRTNKYGADFPDIIIDLTRKITHNYDDFVNHSLYLAKLFYQKKDWYMA